MQKNITKESLTKGKQVKHTMDKLVVDVLLVIFEMLDESSLIVARKVCQRWQNIIDENPGIHRKFILEVNGFDINRSSPHLQDFRSLRYEKISFESCRNISPEIGQIISETIDFHKFNIKFANFTIARWNFFAENALKFPNLEKLRLESIECVSDTGNEITLPNLKELEMFDARDLKILAPNLEKLKINGIPSKLLENYPQLTSLSFHESLCIKVDDFSRIPQKLTFLEINSPLDINYIALLESQRETLKEIKLYTLNRYQEMEFAIFNMRAEKLSIKIPEKFEIRGINENLKDLTLASFYCIASMKGGLESVENIFSCCPNIEKLSVIRRIGYKSEILEIAQESLKNLRHLFVSDTYSWEFSEDFELDSIETLSVKNAEKINKTVDLILRCKNLRKIRIENTRIPFMKDELKTQNFEAILLELKELEELSADNGVMLSNSVISMMTNKELKLRKLSLTVDEEILEEQTKLAAKLNGTSIKCIIMKR